MTLLVHSRAGTLILVGGPGGCTRVDWAPTGAVLRSKPSPALKALADWLQAWPLAGPPPLELLDWDGCPPFRRLVLQTLAHDLPIGSTTTYGALARRCGRPGAARATGQALRTNPWPVVIPCHRVCARSGPGGFLGATSGPVLDRKLRLLVLEAEMTR